MPDINNIMKNMVENLNSIVNWIDVFYSTIKHPVFIAIFSSWFTLNLHNLKERLDRGIDTTKQRIFFVRQIILIVSQNRIWLEQISDGTVTLDQGVIHIKHIELMQFSYIQPIDKFLYSLIVTYETFLNTSLAMLCNNKTDRNFIYNSVIENAEAVITSLNILLECYERSLKTPIESFMFQNMDKEQLKIQQSLDEIAQSNLDDLVKGRTE